MPLTDGQASKILAKAIGLLLQETEGIAIETDSILYAVYKKDNSVLINRVDKGAICMVSGEVVMDGQLLWIYNEPVQ